MRTLEEMWTYFREVAMHPDSPKTQVDLMHLAFAAGCFSIVEMMRDAEPQQAAEVLAKVHEDAGATMKRLVDEAHAEIEAEDKARAAAAPAPEAS